MQLSLWVTFFDAHFTSLVLDSCTPKMKDCKAENVVDIGPCGWKDLFHKPKQGRRHLEKVGAGSTPYLCMGKSRRGLLIQCNLGEHSDSTPVPVR